MTESGLNLKETEQPSTFVVLSVSVKSSLSQKPTDGWLRFDVCSADFLGLKYLWRLCLNYVVNIHYLSS